MRLIDFKIKNKLKIIEYRIYIEIKVKGWDGDRGRDTGRQRG